MVPASLAAAFARSNSASERTIYDDAIRCKKVGMGAAGITKVRPGAGIAVVGNPAQCAEMLQQFIDAGCHSFCLSGYLHDEEAERFGRLVRPILAEHNRGRLAA